VVSLSVEREEQSEQWMERRVKAEWRWAEDSDRTQREKETNRRRIEREE